MSQEVPVSLTSKTGWTGRGAGHRKSWDRAPSAEKKGQCVRSGGEMRESRWGGQQRWDQEGHVLRDAPGLCF